MTKTLEQKAETRILKCGNCDSPLTVPKNFYSLEKNKKYDGFYISPGGGLYCSRECFDIFTDD